MSDDTIPEGEETPPDFVTDPVDPDEPDEDEDEDEDADDDG